MPDTRRYRCTRALRLIATGVLLLLPLPAVQGVSADAATEVAAPASANAAPPTAPPNPPPKAPPTAAESAQSYTAVSLLSRREMILALVALSFGMVVVLLEYRLLVRIDADGDQVLKIVVVTLIVVGTMFIITAGYSSEQIAPVIGLFGTIAGYLLGKTAGQKEDRRG